ncbi:hypothetical protein GOP47_0020519 [Adiantum capillus-veneris]|uniref:Uncharacterized protein n=1 Tax=Adiantum capillus-veneris TaxID=13818 RepID=A0A9D4Z721_ADICA|nr:hypothetical protein GOP47_0020519 [Adiantum capillus-veneris]
MMERAKEKGVQVVDMFMDLEAPTISLEIGSHSVTEVQLDGGAVVNLMTEQTMGELGLKQVEPTNIILHLANQRHVKSLGILQGVKSIVASLEFHVSYLIVRPHSYGASFPILLGRPWLVQARTEENTDYSGDKSEDEEAVKQSFSLDTDKYSRFLHNGYHMRIEDDSTGTIFTLEGVGYDSDKDIAQWLSTSFECLANCFNITLEDDLEDMDKPEGKSNALVEVNGIWKQLEKERELADKAMAQVLQKMARLEKEKGQAILEAKQSK